MTFLLDSILKKCLAVHEWKWQVHDQLPFCYLICSKSICIGTAEKLLTLGPWSVVFTLLSPQRHSLKDIWKSPGREGKWAFQRTFESPPPGLGGGYIDGRSLLLTTTCLAVTGHPGMQVSWEKEDWVETAQLSSRQWHLAGRRDGFL